MFIALLLLVFTLNLSNGKPLVAFSTMPPPSTTHLPSESTESSETTTPETTTPETTTPETTTEESTGPPMTRREGCYLDGRFYEFGEDITRGRDINFCYGSLCDYDGSILLWDDWNCGPTTPATTAPPWWPETTPPETTTPETTTPETTTPETTTPETTTPETTTPETTPPETTTPETTPPETTTPETTTPDTTTPETTTPDTTESTSSPLPTTAHSTTISQTTPPPTTTAPRGCLYGGKFYLPGDISRGSVGDKWCYGLTCNVYGEIEAWDDWDCGTATTSPPTTEPPHPGCYHNGVHHPPGEITRGTDGNLCIGVICTPDGEIQKWHDWKCTKASLQHDRTVAATQQLPPYISTATLQQTTKLPLITTDTVSPMTTLPNVASYGCLHEGSYYEDGDLVSDNFDGNNWCYGLICDNGNLTPWDNFNCGSTTLPPSTKTSPPPKTTLSPDEMASSPSDTTQLTSSINTVPLQQTTEVPSAATIPPTTSIPTTLAPLSGCVHRNKHYEDGDLVSENFYGDNWCYGLICDNGNLMLWDNFNCGSTTKTPAPPKITLSPDEMVSSPSDTTQSTPSINTVPLQQTTEVPSITATAPPMAAILNTIVPSSGCVHDGRHYEDGDFVSNNFDVDNWCYDLICDNGNLKPWNNFNCGKTTFQPSTTTPPPKTTLSPDEIVSPPSDTTQSRSSPNAVPPRTTIPTNMVPSSGCVHEGKHLEDGDFVSDNFDGDNWCYGLYCDKGMLVPWDDSNCGSTTILPGTTPPPPPKVTPSPDERVSSPAGTIQSTSNSNTPNLQQTTTNAPQKISTSLKEETSSSGKTTSSPQKLADSPEKIASSLEKTTSPTEKGRSSSRQITSLPEQTTTLSTSGKITSLPEKTTSSPEETTSSPNKDTSEQITSPSDETTSPREEITSSSPAIALPTSSPLMLTSSSRPIFSVTSSTTSKQVTTSSPPPSFKIQTTLPGCTYNNHYYPPGVINVVPINHGRCLEMVCNKNGKVLPEITNNCKNTLGFKTTRGPTTPSGCRYNLRWYKPGVIAQGNNGDGWCYRVLCHPGGKVYMWGSYMCKQGAAFPAPPENKCYYEGWYYPAGKITSEKSVNGWCYGVTCNSNGQVVLWGSFSCGKE